MPFLMRPWILLNCTSLATGPICVPSAKGSPTLMDSAAAFAICAASACLAFGTNMRDGALQDCPELDIMFLTPCETAFFKSASSSTMFGDLPPNSCATRLTVSAAALATAIPARVDPVNDIMSIPGCDDIASPPEGPA